MDPTQIAQMLQLFGSAAGASDGGTGMAALMNGGGGAGILDPNMTQQLAANQQAPITLGGADVMSPTMTAQMAQNPTAGVANGDVPSQTSPIDVAALAKQLQTQRQVGQAPSPIAGRGVDRADPQKAQVMQKISTLAQLLGAR